MIAMVDDNPLLPGPITRPNPFRPCSTVVYRVMVFSALLQVLSYGPYLCVKLVVGNAALSSNIRTTGKTVRIERSQYVLTVTHSRTM